MTITGVLPLSHGHSPKMSLEHPQSKIPFGKNYRSINQKSEKRTSSKGMCQQQRPKTGYTKLLASSQESLPREGLKQCRSVTELICLSREKSLQEFKRLRKENFFNSSI